MDDKIPFPPENRIGRRLLFTPGPLTTTRTVRSAMLEDIGSWDSDCIELVREIRTRLAALTGDPEQYTCTLLQGSGSYGVEAVIGSALPRDGKLLVLKNGAYGERMALTCEALGVPHRVIEDREDRPHDPAAVDRALADDAEITHVAAVHCETTTGVLNPLREIGLVVQKHGRRFLADTISSFGAYSVGPGAAIDLDAGPIDHLVGSANKCLEGTPGFTFVLSHRDAMEAAAGNARSLCLDLHAQWSHFEKTGQFRYTPPTHVLRAFRQALDELDVEGGVAARGARYAENHRVLVKGMSRLGFEAYVPAADQSHIITAFLYPDARFDFRDFYRRLHHRGYIIYPGKLSTVDTFRIANIGSIGSREIRGLLAAIESVRAEAQ